MCRGLCERVKVIVCVRACVRVCVLIKREGERKMWVFKKEVGTCDHICLLMTLCNTMCV